MKGHPAVLECAVVSSPYMMTQVNHINKGDLCGIFGKDREKAKGD